MKSRKMMMSKKKIIRLEMKVSKKAKSTVLKA